MVGYKIDVDLCNSVAERPSILTIKLKTPSCVKPKYQRNHATLVMFFISKIILPWEYEFLRKFEEETTGHMEG